MTGSTTTYWDSPVLIIDGASSHTEMRSRGQDATEIYWKPASDSKLSLTAGFTAGLPDPLQAQSSERPDGLWRLDLTTPQASFLPGFELQFAAGQFDWNTSRGFDDRRHQTLRFKSVGQIGGLAYGTSHTSVGEDYTEFEKGKTIKDRGRSVSKIWLSQSFGRFSLQPFVQRTRSNIARDPSRPVLTDAVAGVSLDHSWSSWPYFGTAVSYASGTRTSSNEPDGLSPFQTDITVLSAHATVSLDTGSLYASVERTTPAAAKPQTGNQPVINTLYASASFYPDSSFSLTPSVTVSEETYPTTGATTRTIGSYLSMALQPRRHDYQLTAYASYDASQNAHWNLNTRYFYSEVGVLWNIGRSPDSRRSLSLTLAYDNYEDRFFPHANTSDIALRLTFRAAALAQVFSAPGRAWGSSSASRGLRGP